MKCQATVLNKRMIYFRTDRGTEGRCRREAVKDLNGRAYCRQHATYRERYGFVPLTSSELELIRSMPNR